LRWYVTIRRSGGREGIKNALRGGKIGLYEIGSGAAIVLSVI
jgi:hypothetical protein